MEELASISKTQKLLYEVLEDVRTSVGYIQIGSSEHFPFGWRKAAKGRTVWRIIEECINQKLELLNNDKNICVPATSEVGVFDFNISFPKENLSGYVNIKSATKGRKSSKDDLSKAQKLLDFYSENPSAHIFIATFEIEFHTDMRISLPACHVMPIAWIPDVYVNPSNNGNLQSSKYKDLTSSVQRTNKEFIELLSQATNIARKKRTAK